MAGYIERDAVCAACNNGEKARLCSADCILHEVPAADVEPVKYGHWEWIKDDIYRCTNCGEESHVKKVMGKPDWVGCPNCRAKMDGGENHE